MAFPSCKEIGEVIPEVMKPSKAYTAKEITNMVANHLNLTDAEREESTNTGSNKLHTRVSVQVSNMVKSGKLVKEGKMVRLA
jgi:restriction endonuclease Mrr